MIFINDILLEFKSFPNGESFLDISNDVYNNIVKHKDDRSIVQMKYENDIDIIHLKMIKDYLDNNNYESELLLPYVPYSRMDRKENSRLFSLKSFADLVNAMNFRKVTIFEPHSDVCVALLNRVVVKDSSKSLVDQVLWDMVRTDPNIQNIVKYSNLSNLYQWANDNNIYLVFPDTGAEKRYGKLFTADSVSIRNIITCSKCRDFDTGRILKLEAHIPESIKPGFRAIIVDDLCSSGGTFILTAKTLKDAGAGEITLVVTHCEDTITKGEILTTDTISKVYTTDSILKANHDKINRLCCKDF